MSCPKCYEGHVLPGEPTGSFPEGYLGAYLAPGTEETTGHGRAIILLTDAFGLPLKNCKLIADTLASRLQCDVWVPDYFAGRPIAALREMIIPERAEQKMSLTNWVKFIGSSISGLPAFYASRPSVVAARLASLFEVFKEKKKYTKIGAVGYCYGGSTAIRLGSTNFVDTVIICHPGPFTIDDVRAVRVPISWVCSEVDMFFADDFKKQCEEELASRKGTERWVEHEFKEYKGTAHGFASRPNPEYPEIMEAYERALDQKVQWFEKILKLEGPHGSEVSSE